MKRILIYPAVVLMLSCSGTDILYPPETNRKTGAGINEAPSLDEALSLAKGNWWKWRGNQSGYASTETMRVIGDTIIGGLTFAVCETRYDDGEPINHYARITPENTYEVYTGSGNSTPYPLDVPSDIHYREDGDSIAVTRVDSDSTGFWIFRNCTRVSRFPVPIVGTDGITREIMDAGSMITFAHGIGITEKWWAMLPTFTLVGYGVQHTGPAVQPRHPCKLRIDFQNAFDTTPVLLTIDGTRAFAGIITTSDVLSLAETAEFTLEKGEHALQCTSVNMSADTVITLTDSLVVGIVYGNTGLLKLTTYLPGTFPAYD